MQPWRKILHIGGNNNSGKLQLLSASGDPLEITITAPDVPAPA